MRGVTPPFPHTSSCHAASLNTGTTLPLPTAVVRGPILYTPHTVQYKIP